MILYSDTGLYRLTVRKPADTSQAPFLSGDNSQPFKYHDLTESSKRACPSAACIFKFSGFVFLKYTKPVGEQKSASFLTLLQAYISHSLALTISSRY